ncbi:MAG: Uma2 family endonuclease [Cyanobacteria bacterium J06635_1]
MVQALEKHDYTSEEYLAFEVESQERHEYIDGDIILMSGGTPNHSKITLNLASSLNFGLKRQPYDVFASDQRLQIPKRRIYTYPDVMVIAQPLEYAPNRRDTLTNPLIIAEVLSKSTEAYDRSGKFAAYRTIPSFQEYVLIDQYAMHVEHYVKTDNRKWIFSEYDGAEAVLTLSSVAFEIGLADLYDKVDFEKEAATER